MTPFNLAATNHHDPNGLIGNADQMFRSYCKRIHLFDRCSVIRIFMAKALYGNNIEWV